MPIIFQCIDCGAEFLIRDLGFNDDHNQYYCPNEDCLCSIFNLFWRDAFKQKEIELQTKEKIGYSNVRPVLLEGETLQKKEV